MANLKINQVYIDQLYDIEAKYFGGMTPEEFIEHVNSVQLIVSTNPADTPKGVSWKKADGTSVVGTLEASQAKKGCIYLVSSTNETGDIYDEYLPVGNNWEKIGNTDVDLSNYVIAGTDTKAPSVNSTGGVAGAGETTTSQEDGYDAKGTASVVYKKADAATGATTNSTDALTEENGDHTHTFTGSVATISITSSGTAEKVDGHTHSLNPVTETVLKSVGAPTDTVYSAPESTKDSAGHTHTVKINSHEHGANVSVVTEVGGDGTVDAITSVTPSTITIPVDYSLSKTTIYQITGVGSTPTKKDVTGTNVAGVSGTVLYIGSAIGGHSNTVQTIQIIDSVGSNPTRSSISVGTSLSASTNLSVVTGVDTGSTPVLTKVKATKTVNVAAVPSASTLTITSESAGIHSHEIDRTAKTVVTTVTPSTVTV